MEQKYQCELGIVALGILAFNQKAHINCDNFSSQMLNQPVSDTDYQSGES